MGNKPTMHHERGDAEYGLDIQLEYTANISNYYSTLVQGQKIALISTFALESGVTIHSVPVAYSTWGTLNEDRSNVLVLCHALTGSSDAQDWWRPLMGFGKALDPSRYFIFCANVLGSPYGSASPLSINPATGLPYGPEFPATTIRDDVRIHKLILDALGVPSVAVVIGGSMGGMTTLEWSLCAPPGYVKNIIPIATSAYHGAWGISWGETQRQAIYSDGKFKNGWYEPTPDGQPQGGLGTARMIAMLTYRSHGSFESRFSRRPATRVKTTVPPAPIPTPPSSHTSSISSDLQETKVIPVSSPTFSAQSYMQYQADKFLKRFDANCYIHLINKMDSHDVTHGRLNQPAHTPTEDQLRSVLANAPPNALVVSVGSDVLFRPEQQAELAKCLPDATLVELDSPDGHDGFLLEFETLNRVIKQHLQERFHWIYEGEARVIESEDGNGQDTVVNSVFGEAETTDF